MRRAPLMSDPPERRASIVYFRSASAYARFVWTAERSAIDRNAATR
jgi:hypothetical protein